jgi:ribosomal protein S18 acetylase RimI-like enzyme
MMLLGRSTMPELVTMVLRPATAEDALPLAWAHVDSWRAAYRGLVPDSRLDAMNYDSRAAFFRERLAARAAEWDVVEQDGQVLGFVIFDGCRDADVDALGTGEIWGIYLEPQVWRQGAGTLLIRHAERVLASRGCREVKIWVLKGNNRARCFYEALGFRPDGASKTIDLGAPLEEVRYAKRL